MYELLLNDLRLANGGSVQSHPVCKRAGVLEVCH